MTLLQGDKCCGCLLSWGLEKNREGAQPTGFPWTHGAHEWHGADRTQAGTPSLSAYGAILRTFAEAPARGNSPELISAVKLLGLRQFSLLAPLLMEKLKTREGNLEKEEIIIFATENMGFPFTAWPG